MPGGDVNEKPPGMARRYRITAARRGISRDPTAQEPLLVEGARRQAGEEEECAGNYAFAGVRTMVYLGSRARLRHNCR
ncbi:hypothetical protein GPNADHDJ_03665 [Stenotrophomonas maltophilia]|uniref:Uncharacterized protein n=1 Tax=Stenotrophomonas maltophilia TaxID=40324 RepID=A0AAX1IGX5_STEMA|nr:hypothetical protein GPNADHDJ_03665 [Stenotrophomonas maltophilia]